MRYFYYISQPKVAMLRPQGKSPRAKLKSVKPTIKFPGMPVDVEFTEEDAERDSLVRGVEEICKSLESAGNLSPLDGESVLKIGPWYKNLANWHAGVVAFQGGMSFSRGAGVATYLLWKIHRSSLLVLVGSPRNLLSDLKVSENLFFQGTSGALMEVDRIFTSLKTDESRALFLTEPGQERNPWTEPAGVLWEGEAYIDESTTLSAHTAKSSFLKVPSEMSWARDDAFRIGAICLDFLGELPEAKIEVAFRFFSKHKIKRGPKSELERFLSFYEEGLSGYNGPPRKSQLRSQEFMAIYVGSPLYTALA